MAYLNSGRLNLASLRDISRRELVDLLDSIEGSKSMIWDPKLVTPFGLISDYSVLKEHKISQMLELKSGRLPQINSQNVVYFVQPILSHMNIIGENIMDNVQSSQQNVEFHLIFVPRECLLCERKLEALGVLGNIVTFTSYSPDFFIHDADLLSIERPLCFKECTLENDYSSLYQCARSLMTLQCVFGLFPLITGIGKCSKLVFDFLLKMRREISASEPSTLVQFDQVILIDRSVDLLSPMVQQLSYEGLLDEIYGIRQTVVELPSDKFISDNDNDSNMAQVADKKRFHLNSGEELFKKLRDAHYLAAGPILKESAKNLSTQFDERKFAKTVRDLKQFVDKIPYLQKLRTSQANHTSILELVRQYTDREEYHELLYAENELLNCLDIDTINPYIEIAINKSESLDKVLRLIAIQSFCANGLKPKVLEFYKHEILQTYGYEHLLTLQALENSGVIRVSGSYGFSGRSYSMAKNRLKLTWNVPTLSTAPPGSEIAQVHNGYVPLTTRLVQQLEQFGYRSLQDVLSRHLLKSDVPVFEEHIPMSSTFRKRRYSDTTSMQSSPDANQKLTLVFFIGGCTYAEISALRGLSAKEGINSDFVVATTSIINGNSFCKNLCD